MATLESMLASPDQSTRLKAVLAAGTYPQPEYIEILINQCSHEPDFFVRDTLSWALLMHDHNSVVSRLIPELASANKQAKSQAIHTLSKIGDKKNFKLIADAMLFDPDDLIASTAWRAASVLVSEEDKPALVAKLVTQLGRGDSDLQFALTRFLCAIGESIVVPLKQAAKSKEPDIQQQAEFTLIRYQEMKREQRENR